NPSLNVGVAMVTSRLGSWNLQGAAVGFQAGTSIGIECNDPRLLNAVFRNGSIWTAHSIFFPANGFPTRAAAQWWQINPNGSVIQQGQIDDPAGNTSYGFPSIGVNKNNDRSEEHTSELQSPYDLVCRLLLEKKKKKQKQHKT